MGRRSWFREILEMDHEPMPELLASRTGWRVMLCSRKTGFYCRERSGAHCLGDVLKAPTGVCEVGQAATSMGPEFGSQARAALESPRHLRSGDNSRDDCRRTDRIAKAEGLELLGCPELPGWASTF